MCDAVSRFQFKTLATGGYSSVFFLSVAAKLWLMFDNYRQGTKAKVQRKLVMIENNLGKELSL